MKALRITQSITNRDDLLKSYFKDISKYKPLTAEEEKELFNKAKEGDNDARELLFKSNLKFVVSVAKQYQNQGLPLVDLISEGNIGLLKSLDKFNPERGFKFISYAVWWIRQAILFALAEKGRTIKIPVNQTDLLRRANKINAKYEQEFERPADNIELEDELEISSKKLKSILNCLRPCVSIDLPINDEESSTLIDVIPNKNSELADESSDKESKSKIIDLILNKFTERESDIVKMFFGIGMQEMSLEEIGKRFSLTPERVGQIKNGTIKTIKEKYINLLLD